jgi:DNA-binding transcriptional LysR family regulator
MNLNKLKVFYYAAKAGSFTHCGLNLAPSSISRHIAQLEHELKVELFHRYPQRIILTEQGVILFQQVQKIIHQLELIKPTLFENEEHLQGLMKVVAQSGWIETFLLGYITEFAKVYPQLRLNVLGLDYMPSSLENEICVLIQPFKVNQPHWQHRLLAQFELRLYASKEYLEKNGVPQKPEDLDYHRLICCHDSYGYYPESRWHLTIGAPTGSIRSAHFIVDNTLAATVLGLGISTLAVNNPYLKQTDLVPVLPAIKGPSFSIYYNYPEHFRDSPKVTALAGFLEHKFKNAA